MMIDQNYIDKAFAGFRNTIINAILTRNAALIEYSAVRGAGMLNELQAMMVKFNSEQKAGKMVVGIHPEQ